MAKSSTSMLSFFAVLLAVVVEHGGGMRGSPGTESMLETEVSWWGKNPCKEFGAEMGWIREDCECPDDRPRTTKECGGRKKGDQIFHHSKASKGCRCVTKAEAQELLRMPVAASALRFCSALAEQSYESMGGARSSLWKGLKQYMPKSEISPMYVALKKTSPQICQHALTGTITPTEAKEAPFAEKASELSRHGHDEDKDGDRAYGRMRAVKEDATDPAEKALWEHALSRVCKDECTDLLDMMKKETDNLEEDVLDQVPFAQACAERVVQHVEAEVLGCCARSCGFDGRRCLLWPFFSPQEKVDWELECCAEISILKDSSRELMCNSVLPDRLAKEASQYDLNEQAGVDIGKVLIGQNTSLFWTEKGAQESALGKEIQAHGGDKVSMEFLIKHQKIGEEYLRLGYFKEEPITKLLNESTSLVEVSSQDGTCDFGKFQLKCPQQWMDTYTKACKESWMMADEEEPGFFMDQITGKRGGNCSVDKSTNFAAPENCDELANNSFGEILVVYFTYDHDDTEKPIACVTVGKEQCRDEKWLKDLELKPMHEVMNGLEIKNYRDHSIYYVKVKADTKQTNQ